MRFILEKPALALAIGVSLITGVGLVGWFAAENLIATDFSVYHRAANEPLSQVYAPRDELPFPYAPTMLLWIAPLAIIPLWLAFVLWVSASAAALWFACRRHLDAKQAALVVFSPPLINGLATGQVSALLAALLLWSCSTRDRLSAGIALGVIASVKPQLVIMAPLFLLLRRDWQAVAAAALAFLVVVILALLAFGAGPWFDWVESLDNFRRVLRSENVLSVAATPAAVAERFHLPPLPFWLVGVALGVWLVAACRNADPLKQCAAIGAGSLLAAPYALTYDLAPVIPFLVWSVFRGSISSAIAMSGAAHPLPLVLSVANLLRKDHAKPSQPPRLAGICLHPVHNRAGGRGDAGCG